MNFYPKFYGNRECFNRNILCISYFPDLLYPFAVKIFVEIFMWKAQCKIQQRVFHQSRYNKASSIYRVRVEKLIKKKVKNRKAFDFSNIRFLSTERNRDFTLIFLFFFFFSYSFNNFLIIRFNFTVEKNRNFVSQIHSSS